jgi:hypothetical protein
MESAVWPGGLRGLRSFDNEYGDRQAHAYLLLEKVLFVDSIGGTRRRITKKPCTFGNELPGLYWANQIWQLFNFFSKTRGGSVDYWVLLGNLLRTLSSGKFFTLLVSVNTIT